MKRLVFGQTVQKERVQLTWQQNFVGNWKRDRMSKHLLDTAILIDCFRGKDNAHDWLADFSGADLSISVVTAAELLEGCFNRKEQESVMNKLATY